jgi:hypothetical protein
MAGQYFRKESWRPFSYKGELYTLDHLDEFEIAVVDTSGTSRRIAVTFGDHCFTKRPVDPDPQLVYSDSDRNPGHFCFDRYALSLDLPNHMLTATQGQVWNAAGDSFAVIPVVDNAGREIVYRIVFSLERVKGLPVELHMRVKTAYPADNTPFATFGSIRFRHLVALVAKNQKPKRITDERRKRPRIS